MRRLRHPHTSAEEWQSSTIIGDYDPGVIRDLKDRTEGIYISGSGMLVRGAPLALALTEHQAYDNGVLHLSYRPA